MRPAKFSSFVILMSLPVLFFGQFRQVEVCRSAHAEELSVSINPENPAEMLSATRTGYFLSSDTGRTWHPLNLFCANQSLWRSPVVFWHRSSKNFSFVTNGDTNVIDVHKRVGDLLQGSCNRVPRAPGMSIQKLDLYLSPHTSDMHAVWTQCNAASDKSRDSSFTFYSRSPAGVNKWTAPVRISGYGGGMLGDDKTLMGAMVCTGPDGEVYATWAGPKGLMFRNLRDKAASSETPVASLTGGWKFKIGEKIWSNGLPSIACDLSGGEHRGRIYICWSDEKHGVNNKNIFLICSDDKGKSWTEPILVTYRPNHKEQFLPRMALDQSTGYVYLIYLDQQNYTENDLSDVYLARSMNGGLKFDYYRLNEQPVKRRRNNFSLECLALSTVNNFVRPLWVQGIKKNKQLVYSALIDEARLAAYDSAYSEMIRIPKTFVFSENIDIDFELEDKSIVSAELTRPTEPGFKKLIIKRKKMPKGKNRIVVNTKKLGLEKGNYTLTLYHQRRNTFVWILEE